MDGSWERGVRVLVTAWVLGGAGAATAASPLACANGSTVVDAEDTATLDPAQPSTPSSVLGEPPASSSVTTLSDAAADSGATAPTASDGSASTTTTAPPPASTFVNGTVAGIAITPAHASAVVVTSAFGSVDRIVIAIETLSGFCADYASGIDRANSHTLILAILSADPTSMVAPATYTIGVGQPSSPLGGAGTGPFGNGAYDTSARVVAYDSQCKTTLAPSSDKALSGTITLTQVAGGTVAGTFTLGFPGGGQLSGALSANVCTSPGANTFTCMP